MKFRYSARTQEGELQVGSVEAGNRDMALNILGGHNLFILTLEEEGGSFLGKIAGVFNRVKSKDLMIFTQQFAILMESHVPLNTSLRSLYKQTRNPALKQVVAAVSQDVDGGLSLSQALEHQGNVFSEFYINMIRSAEVSGRLQEATMFLANYLEKEITLRSHLRNSMIYPVTIIVLFIIVAAVMVTVIFPQIAPIFEESNVKLPLITKIFLNAGSFLGKWWWAISLGLGMVVFTLVDYFRSDEGKVVFNEMVLRLPIFGNLTKKIYVARFAESASVLIKGGIPVTQAIEIAGHSTSSTVYGEILHEVAEGLRAGEPLSTLLAQKENFFPPLVPQLIAIGEGSGRVDEILSKISTMYTREINDSMSGLIELVQPLLIAVVGVLVGLLFASILVPIYNLVQVF